MIRRNITMISCALILTSLFAGAKAHADVVHFRYNGGSFSRSFHSGWNRYWGGPSIGFYYAEAPVYIVDGYSAPSYYTDSSFWYSNPSFGLSINLGGGGYYGGGYGGGGHYYRGGDHFSGGGSHFSGGGHGGGGGGHFSGGGGHGGGGHSGGGGHRR